MLSNQILVPIIAIFLVTCQTATFFLFTVHIDETVTFLVVIEPRKEVRIRSGAVTKNPNTFIQGRFNSINVLLEIVNPIIIMNLIVFRFLVVLTQTIFSD